MWARPAFASSADSPGRWSCGCRRLSAPASPSPRATRWTERSSWRGRRRSSRGHRRREAPAAVARLLRDNAEPCRELGRRLRGLAPPFAVSCARGSSDNAATYGKYLLEIRLSVVTASVGPSVRSVYTAAPRMKQALFFAVSQSGRSPDLLHLAQAARSSGALTVALVNDTESPLADICEVTLPLSAGPERSVAATKSFICSLAAILQM